MTILIITTYILIYFLRRQFCFLLLAIINVTLFIIDEHLYYISEKYRNAKS